jgi:hypothetical protein
MGVVPEKQTALPSSVAAHGIVVPDPLFSPAHAAETGCGAPPPEPLLLLDPPPEPLLPEPLPLLPELDCPDPDPVELASPPLLLEPLPPEP